MSKSEDGIGAVRARIEIPTSGTLHAKTSLENLNVIEEIPLISKP
jgi:hypothetical protein